MIYLYESTETDFRYNGKPLPAAYDVTVSHTLNSEYYVMGKYPLDKHKVYKEIVEDRIIKAHTIDGMEPFRIVSVSKHELYVEFEAWPLFFADMRNKLVKPINISGGTGQAVLNRFRDNLLIDPPFSFYSDITDTYDYYTQDESERESNPKQLYNALDVFKDIVATWGGEVWIRGYVIRLNERIETHPKAMLYEKKNITEFVDTTNIEGIVTRLHGKSEWQDERNEDGEDGEKHLIEATVDSPLIDYYGGVVFEQQLTNNDLRTKEELEEWLLAKFEVEHIDKPQRTIEVGTNLIGTDELTMGDTLILKYTQHDVDMRIKVIGYEHDGVADETTKIILGEPKQTFTGLIAKTTYQTYARMKEIEDKFPSDSGAGESPTTPSGDDDASGSPGSKLLIAGDMQAGFFGEVPASELFTASEIASACGITQGTAQHANEPWLKFAYEGKILFRPRKALRISISWDAINEAECVYGGSDGKTVTKDGKQYRVRLMRGALTDPSRNEDSDRGAKGSEWNKLMLPIHEQAIDKSWAYPAHVEENVPTWAHNLGTGANGMYSDADLITSSTHGSGSYVWQQETTSSDASLRVIRGRSDVSNSTSNTSSAEGSHRGWAPVLELIN